ALRGRGGGSRRPRRPRAPRAARAREDGAAAGTRAALLVAPPRLVLALRDRPVAHPRLPALSPAVDRTVDLVPRGRDHDRRHAVPGVRAHPLDARARAVLA